MSILEHITFVPEKKDLWKFYISTPFPPVAIYLGEFRSFWIVISNSIEGKLYVSQTTQKLCFSAINIRICENGVLLSFPET